MISLLLALLLAILAIVVVLLPFLRKPRGPASSRLDAAEQLKEERQNVYGEMQTLQQDFELGHMAREDYESHIRSLRLQAAGTFREQTEREAELKRLDAALEQEISAHRSKNGNKSA